MKLIYSKICLKYKKEGHPESPERIKNAKEWLAKKGYKFVKPRKASLKELKLVHQPRYIEKIKKENFIGIPDNPLYKKIFKYACLSAGSAIKASEQLAFSLLRPPGHHAGFLSMAGFCYFNNIAIAVEKLLRKGKKILIVDIDGHHGNGTQEIFKGKSSVVYLSLHRSPYYPGTGLKSEQNCINFPLDAECGDEKWLSKLKEGLEKSKKMLNPDLIAISAGFDTYKGDLASLGLTTECYWKAGELIGSLKKPVFCVLEGGYGKHLGICIEKFINGLES